jgi:kumamolisin
MSDAQTGHARRQPGARSCAPISPDAIVRFALLLRYAPASQVHIEEQAAQLLAGSYGREPRDTAAAIRAADPADVAAIRRFASTAGLVIEQVDAAARTVRVSGPASKVNDLFGIALLECTDGTTSWRDYDGEWTIPGGLQPFVESSLGLSTKPVA